MSSGKGRQVVGQTLQSFVNHRIRFYLEQAMGGSKQRKLFHTHCPHQPPFLTVVRTLSPPPSQPHNLPTPCQQSLRPTASHTVGLKVNLTGP